MRAVRIPLFVLLAVLFFILWNAAWVTDRCGEWTAAVDTVTADLDAGGDGGAALGTLDDLWQDVQGYMHIIVSHEDLDEAEALMAQAKALSAQGSTEELYPVLAQLRHHGLGDFVLAVNDLAEVRHQLHIIHGSVTSSHRSARRRVPGLPCPPQKRHGPTAKNPHDPGGVISAPPGRSTGDPSAFDGRRLSAPAWP